MHTHILGRHPSNHPRSMFNVIYHFIILVLNTPEFLINKYSLDNGVRVFWRECWQDWWRKPSYTNHSVWTLHGTKNVMEKVRRSHDANIGMEEVGMSVEMSWWESSKGTADLKSNDNNLRFIYVLITTIKKNQEYFECRLFNRDSCIYMYTVSTGILFVHHDITSNTRNKNERQEWIIHCKAASSMAMYTATFIVCDDPS